LKLQNVARQHFVNVRARRIGVVSSSATVKREEKMKSQYMLAAIAALVFVASGCATQQNVPAGPAPPRAERATVEVTNHNWSDMVIYAESSGKRVRLGHVISMASEVFRIPGAFASTVASLRLVASPIGSNSQFATTPVEVWPGQTVEFRIENQIGISTIQVW